MPICQYAIYSSSMYSVRSMTSRYIHRYRNRIDIIAQLLNAASSPTTKTKMMYKALLSYEQLKEYLILLKENDLITYDKPTGRFSTTYKGYEFIARYEDLTKLIGPVATIVAKEKKMETSARGSSRSLTSNRTLTPS
jgi:predicted transcriptional regulator